MPRGEGIAIKLYGPDTKYGAIKRAGFKAYRWYAVWHEGGRQRQRSTGIEYDAKVTRSKQVETARQAFYEVNRAIPNQRTASETFLVTDALIAYGEGRAQYSPSAHLYADHVRMLVPFFAGKVVDALTEDVLRDYAAYRTANGKASPATARRDIESLQAAVNWCVDNRLLDSRKFKLWKPAKSEPNTRWFTRQEAARLIRAARAERKTRHHLPLFILLSLYTGQRSSHVLRLQWRPNTKGGYVDLERGMIYFQPTGKAQTNKRAATMPIPRRLMPLLRALHTRSTVYVIEYRGKPVSSIKKGFRNACARAGIDGARPHTLRHTCITWLLLNGEDPWLVAGYVNLSIDVLMRVYGHHCPDKLQALANRI